MGELIDFTSRLKSHRLSEAIKNLNINFSNQDIPSPEYFGWVAVEWLDHYPVRYNLPQLDAEIGYCQDSDYVYLDYKSDRVLYRMTLEELALGIETGTLVDFAF